MNTPAYRILKNDVLSLRNACLQICQNSLGNRPMSCSIRKGEPAMVKLPAQRRICCSAIATSQGSCVATTMVLSGSKERMLESTCLAVELSTPAEGLARRRMHGDVRIA